MTIDRLRSIKAVYRLAASKGLSIFLMLASVFLVGVWVIPFQMYGVPSHVTEAYANSIYFRVTFIALLFNGLFCLISRTRNIAKLTTKPHPAPAEKVRAMRLSRSFKYGASDNNLGSIERFMRKRLYRATKDETAGALVAYKWRFAPYGTLIFHLSFFVVLAGILLSQSKFEGKVVVVEGQAFTNARAQLVEPSKKVVEKIEESRLPKTTFVVDRVTPEFWEDKLFFTDLVADVAHPADTLAHAAKIRLSAPLSLNGESITLSGFGYAPGYMLSLPGGGVVENSYVTMKIFPSGFEDSFELKAVPYKVYLKIYSDYVDRGGEPASKSFALKNPRIDVKIEDKSGKQVYKGLVKPSEEIKIGDYLLSFPAIRLYGEFRIIKDPGIPLIFLGIFLACAGLAWRLLLYRRVIYVAVEERDGDRLIHLAFDSDSYRRCFARSALGVIARDLPLKDPSSRERAKEVVRS